MSKFIISLGAKAFILFVLTALGNQAKASNYFIYAAYVNEQIEETCKSFAKCELNLIEQEQLESTIVEALTNAQAAQISNEIHEQLAYMLQNGEYELLVGSAKFQAEDKFVSTIEYTLNWRGIPIFELTTSLTNTSNIKDALSNSLEGFIEELDAKSVLNPKFLFKQVNASDYFNELSLPDTVAGFYRQQMQLQQDPTRGTLVRYEHEEYPTALIDIYVYPIIKHNYETAKLGLMHQELQKDKLVIQSLSEHREIQVVEMTDISAVADGLLFEAQASDGVENMYSSQYIFVREDKFIKFSANMPAQFANSMVDQVMRDIKVPAASEIMNAFRAVDRAFSDTPEEYATDANKSQESGVTAAL